MGRLQAEEMAALTDLDTALAWHLQSNHYPPVPLSMLPVCKDAIELVNNDESDSRVALPGGVTWRGEDSAPAWAIVEQHHLDSFIDSDDEYEGDEYEGDEDDGLYPCDRCGATVHFDEGVWLDDTDGEGCTDDEGQEGVHEVSTM